MKIFALIFVYTGLILFTSCDASDQKQAARLTDSILSADSAQYAELAKIEAEKTNPATFNFKGRWEGDIITLVFEGDSAQLITTTEKVDSDWYRYTLNRAKDPMELDFYLGKRLGFSMILRIDSEKSFTVGFGEDMTVRPTSFVPDHSVTCTKKNNLVH